MRTPVNKPPRSKIVSIIKEDKNKKFMVKESIKGKWKFFAVENKKDKISRQMNNLRTIAEEIAIRQQLVNAGTVESFLLNASSYVNAAEKRNEKVVCPHRTK